MKLENQCCSLKQAKELRELGVIQDSAFYHFPNPNTESIKKKYKLKDYNILYGKDHIGKETQSLRTMMLAGAFSVTYSAFNVAELSVMLGDNYLSWSFKLRKNWKVTTTGKNHTWIATAMNKNERPDGKNVTTANEFDRYAGTQAQALAEMLIATIKVGHVKVKDVNKRLLKA